MEFKGTPAPWGLEYSNANNAYEIAPFDSDGELDWSREVCITADNSKANAHLIAAAPELLEILASMPHPEYRTGITHLTDKWCEWDIKRRAAIAKALGQP